MSKKHWLLLVILGLAGPVAAHNHWQGVEVTSQPLRDNIHVIFGEGGNIALSVGKDGTLMVDDQYAQMSDKILDKVSTLGGDTPKFLINTHWHRDHTGGNENMAEQGSVIIAHDQVRERMKVSSRIDAFDLDLPPSPEKALPVITFGDQLRLHFNEQTIELMHLTPSHTDGDSAVRFVSANIVHTGDVWFNGMYPFIDVEHGGSLAGMITAATQLIELVDQDTIIIPGHGPVGDKAALIAYRDKLQKVHTELRKLKASGLSLQQVIDQQPLAELDAEWGNGFLSTEKWLGIIYPGIQ